MTAVGSAGEIAGGLAGGAVGGVIGSLVFPPVGTMAGRWLGSRLGRMGGRVLGNVLAQAIDDANDAAEPEEAAQERDDTEECETCRSEECVRLEEDINRRLYNSKRRATGLGEQPNGYHGQFPRRAEQICGPNGPGTGSWRVHDDILRRQQDELRRLYEQYLQNGCMGHPEENINWGDYQWATDPSFVPSPSEWLGASHPACQTVPDLIRRGRGRDAVIELRNQTPPGPNVVS